jgi:uncharacterized protein YkwD
MKRRELLLTAAAGGGVGGYVLWEVDPLSVRNATADEQSSEVDPAAERRPDSRTAVKTEAEPPTDEPAEPDVRRLVHDRVSAFREDHDRNPLRWSPALARMAGDWADEMATRGELVHRSGSLAGTATEYGTQCERGGENVARTWRGRRVRLANGETAVFDTAAEVADGLVAQWANSPDHRETMLGLQHFQSGVGVTTTTEGQVWAVQNFC